MNSSRARRLVYLANNVKTLQHEKGATFEGTLVQDDAGPENVTATTAPDISGVNGPEYVNGLLENVGSENNTTYFSSELIEGGNFIKINESFTLKPIEEEQTYTMLTLNHGPSVQPHITHDYSNSGNENTLSISNVITEVMNVFCYNDNYGQDLIRPQITNDIGVPEAGLMENEGTIENDSFEHIHINRENLNSETNISVQGETEEQEENTGNDEHVQQQLEEADADVEMETLTKKGTVRKRKKYKMSKVARKELREKKIRKLHAVLPPCLNCKLKCCTLFSDSQRSEINQQFWAMTWKERRLFIMNSTETKIPCRKKEGSKKTQTFTYFLKKTGGVMTRVCKIFYLTTLGYKKTNDWPIQSAWSKAPSRWSIQSPPDKRGRRSPVNKIPNNEIESHIESFNPLISHYRREHAPNRLYLPSDLSVKLMHQDFLERHAQVVCSYEKYRQVLKSNNISFAKSGNEECELCESFKLHNIEHTPENLNQTCEVCCSWGDHIQKAKTSRQRYEADKEINYSDDNALCVSVDLQKIIMLPRLEMFKKAIFTKRLIAYNESFVPVGKKSKQQSFAVLWHEAISGRNKEDIVSGFYSFFLHHRDKKRFVLWLDNCSSQNKNWTLLSFLIYVINSGEIIAESIQINYFEPGHTFMSADSFHHQVEESLKRQRKTYDFTDFVAAVERCNKGKVFAKQMAVGDFYLWQDFSSTAKIKKHNPRPYLANITEIMVKKGENVVYYKNFGDEDPKILDLLLKKYERNCRGIPKPRPKTEPAGFEKDKVQNILKHLGGIMPENRKQFWINLPDRKNND